MGMFGACGRLAENTSFISIPIRSSGLRHTNLSQDGGDVIYEERFSRLQ